MPKYQMNYEWTCPQCGAYNPSGYHCAKCFYAPNIPKQRLSVIAVALGAGSVLLVIVGAWIALTGHIVLGTGMAVLGGLMGWGAAKW